MKKIKSIILILSMIFAVSCMDMYNDVAEEFVSYNLRDRGPAGGLIFYINPNYKQDGWKYLEAAPIDQNSGISVVWSNIQGTAIGISAQNTLPGTGMKNTVAIINQSGHTNSAAKICRDYRGGGFSDWYLPSKEELWYMCWNLRGVQHSGPPANITTNNPDVPNVPGGGVGGFQLFGYWSSTENNNSTAWYLEFSNGYKDLANTKNGSSIIRAIRAF